MINLKDLSVSDYAIKIQEAFYDGIDKKEADIKSTHISITELAEVLHLQLAGYQKEDILKQVRCLKEDHLRITDELIKLRRENEEIRSSQIDPRILFQSKDHPLPNQLPKGCDMCEQFMQKFTKDMKRTIERVDNLESTMHSHDK